jgi:hypothetical protein
VSRPLRAALGLADQHVQGAALGRVAPHVPLVHALVVRRVPVAARSRVAQHLVVQPLVVLRRVAQVRSRASACFPQLRLLAPQRSAPVQRPSRERPWSLAR